MTVTESALRIEQSPKRVRVMSNGRFVADSSAPLLVWEKPYYPTYFFRRGEVEADVRAGDHAYTRAETELADHVALSWEAFDHWLEEDEEVFVHPKDPYHRIDILRSSRHVQVSLDGVPIADSSQPTLLFETGLPRRHYLPRTDVRAELLEPSETRTGCPYKGFATYWHLRIGDAVHRDVVWSYPTPFRESAPIAGLLCCYDEKLDFVIDGEARARPVSPFS
ncbi:MAG: DUF427 domain-containing protein [Nocardioides sp.]